MKCCRQEIFLLPSTGSEEDSTGKAHFKGSYTCSIFSLLGLNLIVSTLSVRNIPNFKDKANWSRDTFQPMRRHACVYQRTNQNIAPVIKDFHNSRRSRTESVIVLRLSGIFLGLFMRHTQFF